MASDVDLMGAAALIGRSYSYLQENWRTMVREEHFPLPYIGGQKGSRPRWRVAAIERWKDYKSGLIELDMPQRCDSAEPAIPRPSNDPAPVQAAPHSRAARARAMAGGRR